MKLRLAVLALAVALAAAACGDSSQVVATVNGEDISVDYMVSLDDSPISTLNVNTESFRQALSTEIVWAAIVPAAMEELGLSVTRDQIAERIESPPVRYAALFSALEEQEANDTVVENEAARTIWRDLVTAELIRREPGFIEDTLTEAPQEMAAGCVRHILLNSQLEAQAALDRLAAGDDFVALAEELSIDEVSGSGPVSGCPVPFRGFVPAFAFAAATAELNTPVGPIQTQAGFHIILVEDRIGPPTLEELRDDPVNYYPGSTLSDFFTPWFNDVVRAADISVAESVGRWSPEGLGLIPPGQ